LFDSSFTAGDVLSNFPYALPLGLGTTEDSIIYEFPVTMEDEESPGLAGHVESDLNLIEANAENGAINVLLVHPNDPSHKVPAEEAIIRKLPQGVGVSDLLTFARFWRARERVAWTVQTAKDPLELVVSVRAREPIRGLTLEFQCPIAKAEGGDGLRIEGNRLILPAIGAQQEVQLQVHCLGQ
jgi:hypothetical protein